MWLTDCAVAGITLTCYFEAYVRTHVFEAAGMNVTGYLPPKERWAFAAPTWHDNYYRHRTMQGQVSDENSYALGGIAGHAGVFRSVTLAGLCASCQLLGTVDLWRLTPCVWCLCQHRASDHDAHAEAHVRHPDFDLPELHHCEAVHDRPQPDAVLPGPWLGHQQLDDEHVRDWDAPATLWQTAHGACGLSRYRGCGNMSTYTYTHTGYTGAFRVH